MYNNISGKIKVLASVLCWVGIIISVVISIIIFIQAGEAYGAVEGSLYAMGYLILIGGSFFSWIGSFFVYGFGELIEKTTMIAYNTSSNKVESDNAKRDKWKCDKCGKFTSKNPCEFCGYTKTVNKKEMLDDLLKEGLISQTEYENILSGNNKGIN